MNRQLSRVALIGSYLPRPCGIATFSGDVYRSLQLARPNWDLSVVALNDRSSAIDQASYSYPPEVRFEVDQNIDSYRQTAKYLNAGHFDAVFLQHEYGLFAGPAGEMLFELLDNIRAPLVTMLHTVLKEPDEDQFRVLRRLASRSSKVITMSPTGKRFLDEVFHVDQSRVEMMPHGIPDSSGIDSTEMKQRYGFAGRKVVMTFGLLSPGKGLEHAIESIPAIAARHPEILYVVLGATHPHLVKQEGEVYRESLQKRVAELGIEDHVEFVNEFVELDELTRYIAAADVYLTPYLNEAQITSGTLAYAYGCGKAVVSTPYWHAVDLLAEDRGRLVDFCDSGAISVAVNSLFDDDQARKVMCENAYQAGREMIWPAIGCRMAETLELAHNHMLAQVDVAKNATRGGSGHCNERRGDSALVGGIHSSDSLKELSNLTDIRLDHLSALTDDTGLVQHATFDLPNWHEGYCVDDNCRGLLLTLMLDRQAVPEVARLHRIFKTFLNYAFDPATRQIRNFMGFDRTWLERRGSDDSIGRVAWSLGACVGRSRDLDDIDWAASLFEPVLAEAASTTSLRTWAFGMLAGCEFLKTMEGHRSTRQAVVALGQRLVDHFAHKNDKDWQWFEDILTYDNAKIPHALIEAGAFLGRDDMVDVGLRSLGWLSKVQRSSSGTFQPIGNQGFYRRGQPIPTHDQQPLEAWATVSACLSAASVTDRDHWEAEADLALAWFLGRNALRTPVVDLRTGACHDGVQFDRVNRNRGAESTLAWLLAATEWIQKRSSAPPSVVEVRGLAERLGCSKAV